MINISNNLSELLITEGDAVHVKSWSLAKRMYNQTDKSKKRSKVKEKSKVTGFEWNDKDALELNQLK